MQSSFISSSSAPPSPPLLFWSSAPWLKVAFISLTALLFSIPSIRLSTCIIPSSLSASPFRCTPLLRHNKHQFVYLPSQSYHHSLLPFEPLPPSISSVLPFIPLRTFRHSSSAVTSSSFFLPLLAALHHFPLRVFFCWLLFVKFPYFQTEILHICMLPAWLCWEDDNEKSDWRKTFECRWRLNCEDHPSVFQTNRKHSARFCFLFSVWWQEFISVQSVRGFISSNLTLLPVWGSFTRKTRCQLHLVVSVWRSWTLAPPSFLCGRSRWVWRRLSQLWSSLGQRIPVRFLDRRTTCFRKRWLTHSLTMTADVCKVRGVQIWGRSLCSKPWELLCGLTGGFLL